MFEIALNSLLATIGVFCLLVALISLASAPEANDKKEFIQVVGVGFVSVFLAFFFAGVVIF